MKVERVLLLCVHKEDCFVSGRKLEVAIVEVLVMEFIRLIKTSVQGNCSKKNP